MNKQKGIAPILIVILIALALGGYLLYQKQFKPVSVLQPSPSPVTSPEASSSATASPESTGIRETANPDSIVANWKTYENKPFFYQIKYPSNWIVQNVLYGQSLTEGDSLIGINPNNNMARAGDEINIEVVKDKTVEEAIQLLKNSNKLKSSGSFTLGDIKGKRIETTYIQPNQKSLSDKTANPTGTKVSVMFERNGNLYILSSLDYALVTFNKILSTFKFTN